MDDRIPADLDEAVRRIIQGLDEESLRSVRHLDSKTVRAMAHHGIGRWIRNNWDLWKKEGPLYRWAVEHLGLDHPKDISTVIIHCVWADLSRKDRDLDSLLQKLKEHWKDLGFDEPTRFESTVEILLRGSKKQS